MTDKENYMDKAISWAERKSVVTLKACHEGYEDTKVFINTSTKEEIQPDISFVTRGGSKHYTDIAIKTDTPQKLVTRWKLLSMMAAMKSGKLYLLAPKGHKMFTQRLVEEYSISAQVLSL